MQAARLARFRRLLAAALGTSYYRPWLEAASLDSAEKLLGIGGQAEILARLPVLEPDLYLRQPERFASQLGRRPELARLTHPLPGKPRIAVLAEGFERSWRVRIFPNGFRNGLARFRPEVVAGSPERLEQLAQARRDGLLSAGPTHALLALVRPNQSLLDEEQRDRLWEVFRVPVFQQIIGFDGELLAWECEAHSGLHTVEDAAIFEACGPHATPKLLVTSLTDLAFPMIRLATPWRGHLTRRLCGCGHPGERIVFRQDQAGRDAA
jgi:hypothetical protein